MLEQGQRWLPQARRAAFEIYRREAASRWIEASGGSMQPLIGPGTWMLVEFGAAPLDVGDIVLFPLGDLVVAHRLVACPAPTANTAQLTYRDSLTTKTQRTQRLGVLRVFVVKSLAVLRPQSTRLIAKGDAEPYHDRPIDRADVLGAVRALRRGPDGPITTWGCAGRSARAIARLSRWSGHGASLARRATAFLPDPLRRVALRAIPPLARVVALVLLAPFRWAAQIQLVRFQSTERR